MPFTFESLRKILAEQGGPDPCVPCAAPGGSGDCSSYVHCKKEELFHIWFSFAVADLSWSLERGGTETTEWETRRYVAGRTKLKQPWARGGKPITRVMFSTRWQDAHPDKNAGSAAAQTTWNGMRKAKYPPNPYPKPYPPGAPEAVREKVWGVEWVKIPLTKAEGEKEQEKCKECTK